MYGNSLTMVDSFVITAFSMSLVFVALVVISYFIDLIAKVVNRSKTEVVSDVVEETVTQVDIIDESEEIIAVISAAIAATSGKSLQDFVIRNIQPTLNQESAWARAGRAEAMR